MINSIKALIEKLRTKTNKLSPTASQVHVDVPLGSTREEKINKILADYKLINSKMKALNSNKTVNEIKSNEDLSIDTDNTYNTGNDVYRGKSF